MEACSEAQNGAILEFLGSHRDRILGPEGSFPQESSSRECRNVLRKQWTSKQRQAPGAGNDRLPRGGQEGWLAKEDTSPDCSESSRCCGNFLANVGVQSWRRGERGQGGWSQQNLAQRWLVGLCKFPWRHSGLPLLLGKPASIPTTPSTTLLPKKAVLDQPNLLPLLMGKER